MGTSRTVDPELSEKRREYGRRGAQARWHGPKRTAGANNWREGLEKWRAEKPRDHAGYRIENADGEEDTAELYLYDEIDAYWGITARDVTAAVMLITAGTIDVHINSPGGDIFEAHAIYNALRNHPADIHVIVDGLAASAASYIAMAGDTITIASNASMMIHDALTITYGNAADHQAAVDLLEKQSNIIAGIYAERAGGSVEEWRDAMKAETWYDADEAVAAGLATEVSGGATATAVADTRLYAAAAVLPLATAVPGLSEPPSGPAGDATEPSTTFTGTDPAELAKALEGAFA